MIRRSAAAALLCLVAGCSTPVPPQPENHVAARGTVVVSPTTVTDHTGRFVQVLPGTQAHAERGVAYTHSVYAHCGGRYTTFDSRSWDAGQDPFTGTLAAGYVDGSMTLAAEDHAYFETEDRIIDYRPLAPGAVVPPCA